jgi:regulatory protein
VFPADVVVRARLTPGTELDRPRLRDVARERRRARALGVAGAALRVRDLSSTRLNERLARRRIPAETRAETLALLEGAGIVDDARYARNRALALAGRGAGDAAIRYDLSSKGLEAELVEQALEGLEPERDRADRIVSARGRSEATARFLSRRGFAEESVEAAAGEVLG